jgi:hypothetical protein
MSPRSMMLGPLLAAVLGVACVVSGDSLRPDDLAIEIHVVGINGAAVEKSSIGLWKLKSEPPIPGKDDRKTASKLWVESKTGKVWEPVGGVATNDRWRHDNLAPGTYRAAAHLGHEHVTAVGISEPVTLDGSRKETTLTVQLRAGSTVSFRIFDTASNRPLPEATVNLLRDDSDSLFPPRWICVSLKSGEDGTAAVTHLPPGQYRLTASRRAWRPEDLEYSPVEKERKLVVAPQLDQIIQVAMAGRPLTQVEIENRWGWVATGTVVDEAERPVAGAEVRVATGWMTLMGGGTTKTDETGRFTLRFSEGIATADKANAQAAVFTVAKEGYVEKSRSRPGRHLMARQLPANNAYGVEPEKIILRGQPYRIDFHLARPATIAVDLRGPTDSPLGLVGQNDQDAGLTHRQDGPNRWAILPDRPWRFTLTFRKTRFLVRSFPISLPRAGQYRATLRFTQDLERGVDLLEFVAVTGPDGRDIRDRVVGDDPLTRPPVSPDLQRRGRDLLKKMADANECWLGPPLREVKSYQYRWGFTEKDARTFRVGAAPSEANLKRGISYFSSVHHLAAAPEGVTFRQVAIGDDRTQLAYTLKQPITVWAGNGVRGTWHGFLSVSVREGVLVLDSRRFTPIEHRSEQLDEEFSQYFELGSGRHVPLAIRISERGTRLFDWTFQVVEPNLWLFASSHSIQGEVTARLDRILVNGNNAKLIARGEHPAAER